MTEFRMFTVANSAEIVNGNLYAMGAGWNWTFSPTSPMVLIARTEVPISRMQSGEITWTIHLEDEDGHVLDAAVPPPSVSWQVSSTLPNGENAPGVPIPSWTLFSFDSMELPPGRYTWKIECEEAVSSYTFTVVERS